MADLNLSAEDLAALFEQDPAQHPEIDELAGLLGEPAAGDAPSSTAMKPSAPPVTRGAASLVPSPSVAEDGAGPAWLAALHLVPGYEAVVQRYPAITERQHPEFGRVIVLAYLEDKTARIRRNFKVGSELFFFTPELQEIAPDTSSLNCRVVIKIIRYQVGTTIRCWENRPGGDVPGMSRTIHVTERGLMLARLPGQRGHS